MLSLSMTTCRRKKKGKPKPGPPPLNQAVPEVSKRYSSLHAAAAGYCSNTLDSKVPRSSPKLGVECDKATNEGYADDWSSRRGNLLTEPMMRTFLERNERRMEGTFNTSAHLPIRNTPTSMQHQYPRQHPYEDRYDDIGGPVHSRALFQTSSKTTSTAGSASFVPTGAAIGPNLHIPCPTTLVDRPRVGSCLGVCRCLERLIDRAFEECDNASNRLTVLPIDNDPTPATETIGQLEEEKCCEANHKAWIDTHLAIFKVLNLALAKSPFLPWLKRRLSSIQHRWLKSHIALGENRDDWLNHLATISTISLSHWLCISE